MDNSRIRDALEAKVIKCALSYFTGGLRGVHLVREHIRIRWDNNDRLNDGLMFIKQTCSHLPDSIYEDFFETNRDVSCFTEDQLTEIGLPLISRTDYEHCFDYSDPNWDWRMFYATFPDVFGLLAYSRVGFNPNMDQGLVTYIMSSGALAAEDGLAVCELIEGDWSLTKTVPILIA